MFDPSTAEGQIRMQQAADRRVLTICRVFNEIQTGPNRLSPAMVRELIDHHPGRYDILEAHASPVVAP